MRSEAISVSPCSNPEMGLEEALEAYSGLGYGKFEIFTSWTGSAFNHRTDPEPYRMLLDRFGLRASSLHLPPVKADDVEASLADTVRAARFAAGVGAPVVLYKASDRPTYISVARPFLDAIEGVGVTPVLQNHFGSPISSLDDFREVIDGIGDARMKTLLEVGHFHSAGVSWREGADLLGDSIALIHIKDQVGRQSVPFGEGEVDLPGLFAFMDAAGYEGDWVVEMEVADKENTLDYLGAAYEYVKRFCTET